MPCSILDYVKRRNYVLNENGHEMMNASGWRDLNIHLLCNFLLYCKKEGKKFLLLVVSLFVLFDVCRVCNLCATRNESCNFRRVFFCSKYRQNHGSRKKNIETCNSRASKFTLSGKEFWNLHLFLQIFFFDFFSFTNFSWYFCGIFESQMFVRFSRFFFIIFFNSLFRFALFAVFWTPAHRNLGQNYIWIKQFFNCFIYNGGRWTKIWEAWTI